MKPLHYLVNARLRWERHVRPGVDSQHIWLAEKMVPTAPGFKVGRIAVRIAPESVYPAGGGPKKIPWRADLSSGFGMWEALTPKKYATEAAAKRDAQAIVAAFLRSREKDHSAWVDIQSITDNAGKIRPEFLASSGANSTAGAARPVAYRCRDCGATYKRKPTACARCAGRRGAAARNGTQGKMTKGEAIAYARKIRNHHQKMYAVSWIAHVFDGLPEPDRDEDHISFMRAQGIRLAIGQPDG